MFKKTRMLLSIVCVAALLLQAVPVFALDIPFDLEALGITAGIDMDREPDSLVRRDEFAQMTVQLLGYGGVTAADEPAFADIEGSAYKNAILLLRQMNLVSGTSDSSFNPDQYIRYTEACKILVDALGYSPMLSEPTLENYAFVAGSIGLTKGVDGSAEYISMDGVLRMLYNALDINRMTRVLQNGAVVSYEISEGNTLRRQLMRGTTELQKLEGVVTADRSTYLYAELPALKPTQLEIDGKVFDFDGVAPVGLVGQSVELFVKTVGDYQVITSMQAADSNTIASFHTDDLTSAADNVIRIEPEDQPKQSLRVGADTIYIYNGRPERDYAVQSLSALEDARRCA